jgi:hypothetical protein
MKRGAWQLTYHSAKGLQADAVFLLGDCQHLTSSPYKNQVYRMAGLGKASDSEPYDNAQKDETCGWPTSASPGRQSLLSVCRCPGYPSGKYAQGIRSHRQGQGVFCRSSFAQGIGVDSGHLQLRNC